MSELIDDCDDPWIAAYLKLRQAVLDGTITTRAQMTDYAAELAATLPGPAPGPAAAAFISVDIRLTAPVAADALWTP